MYAYRATPLLDLMAEKGTYFDPNFLVLHNYLDNKPKFLGIGNYNEEGFAAMTRALPLVADVSKAGQVQAASYPLYAWGTTEVGSVDVTSDGTDIFVTFNTTGGWALVSTAVHAAGTLQGIPHTWWGNPVPWRFAGQHGEAVGGTQRQAAPHAGRAHRRRLERAD